MIHEENRVVDYIEDEEKTVETKQNILKGAMILSIGVMLSKIIGLVYRIPLTNIIGDEGNGLYTSAYQVYVVILTLTATAIPAGLSKLIAEREAVGAHREAERIFKLTLKGSMICALVLAVIVSLGADFISDLFFPNEHVGQPIRVLVPTILIATMVASLRGYFQGLGNMVPTAKSQVIEQIVHVIFTVALAYYLINKSLMSAITGATLGTSIGAFVALIILMVTYKKVRRERKPLLEAQTVVQAEDGKVILKKILEIILPIIIGTSVFSIMTFIDLSMITSLLPESLRKLKESGLIDTVPVPEASKLTIDTIATSLKGQYGFQYNTFINIPVSLIIQLAAASIPAIAASVAVNNQQEVDDKIKMIFKLGMIIGVPTSVAFLIFGQPIIGLVLVKGTGGELLSAGAISLIFITIAQLSAAVMQAMGKPLQASIHAIGACLIKVVMNYVLIRIPQLHIFGVVYSTIICYVIYSALNLGYLYRHFKVRLEWKDVVIKPVFCSVIMGVTSYGAYIGMNQILGRPKVSMLLVIPFAIVVYFATAIITKTITKDDLSGLPGGRKLGKFVKAWDI